MDATGLPTPPAGLPRELAARYALIDRHHGAEHVTRPDPDARTPRWQRLLSSQGALVDRLVLRALESLFMSADRPDYERDVGERLAAARALYASDAIFAEPAQYYRPTPDPEEFRVRELNRLRGGRRLKVTFRSTYRTFDPNYERRYREYARNAINRVHLWRHDAPGRPTVICIHPWCGGILRFEERLFSAKAMYELGLNVALFTMPFHGTRTPRAARFPGQLFPSRDVRRTNEAFGQAIADLRTLMRWLRALQGAGPIGMLGMSLGGYTTALLASLEPDLAFAIPIIAPCSFADILWHHGKGRPGRSEAEAAGITVWDLRTLWSVHCPLMYQLAIPRERVLIVWCEGDHVVPSVHQLALWEHWGQPEIQAFPGGHLLQFGWIGYRNAILRWLADHVAP